MKKNVIIILVVLVIVLIGGYFLLRGNTINVVNNPILDNNNQQSDEVVDPNLMVEPAIYEVIYTDSGYSPSELKIKVGDRVFFRNQSSGKMWTASAMHPSHTVYSGTSLQSHCPDATNSSFDQCVANNPGESWLFEFDKVGTWGYHNHAKAGAFGKIIVE